VRQGRSEEAATLLDRVDRWNCPELLALRDEANLALGFTWLQAGRWEAEQVLQRVRLNGPQSTRPCPAWVGHSPVPENIRNAAPGWN
jgi:hypothetical protein